MWNTIYNDIKNKDLEYVIIQKNNNEINKNISFYYSKSTERKINEIVKEINKNYNIFNTYNDFIVYKRK